ncbi:MAG TPA: chemotaxis protein CheW [Ktedonobacterales bacterium]|jgi:chemotaxis signal transduction protein|nr:chemotaxis protein CheW [Ktedonobacterales bacterium]
MTGHDNGATGDAGGALAQHERMLRRELERAEAGETTAPDPVNEQGEHYLLFWLGQTPCLAPLARLREALPGIPPHVALPFSPAWLWGIFPLRVDLVALVDPMPILLHGLPAALRLPDGDSAREAGPVALGQPEAPRALVVGEGDQLVALVADRLGDVCEPRPEDRQPYQLAAEHEAPTPLADYVIGVYQLAELERPALALDLDRLCGDILAAIEERPADE